MKEFAPPPECPKCKAPMDSCVMEAIMAPPAPTMYLSKWSCSKHSRSPVDNSKSKP